MKEVLKLARDWIAERPADRPVSAGKMISIIDRALAQPEKGLFIDLIAQHDGLAEELAQPEQEPVAYFDWLPEEATHIAQIKVKTRSGGRLEMGAYVFKYDNEVLMVYTTDNDNEYPGWREAKQCFYHLNFPVFPIPTTPPKEQRSCDKRPWVGLTDAEMQALWDRYAHMEMMRAIEAKLKEKNT